jgi:Zn-dependent peptidase ImmA (M78 family)
MNKVEFINIQNLIIARENVGLSTLVASKKISQAKVDLIAKWESGEDLPTWVQVSKLAKIYYTQELLFFSKDLIERNKSIPDYRIIEEVEEDEGVNKLINLVIKRQRWLEIRLKKDGKKNTLLGSGKNFDDPERLAVFIKEKLNISIKDIKKFSGEYSSRKVLNYLIGRAEDHGIFIGKTISYHKIGVRAMRGLFVSNEYCPFIILNRKDAVAAQIFSLIHELAHLFRKTEAISNTLYFRQTNAKVDKEEIFCNKVAAELLLPKNDLTQPFYDKSDIDALAETYKVSKLVIFYRLKDLNKIRKERSWSLEQEIKDETEHNLIAKNNKKKESGGNYVNNMKDSNGGLYNRVVASYYFENKIGYIEASNLLSFSVESV